MITRPRALTTRWTTVVPVLAAVLLIFTWGRKDLPGAIVALMTLVLAGAVLASVHHAEVIAHRVGEPFGSLVLAAAVTIIEVALIVTLMADGGDKSSTLARDTVFAAVMITCNGIVGLCLIVASLRHGTAVFQPRGHRRRPRHRGDPGHAQPGPADLHHQQAGPGVLRRPAHLRRALLTRPLRPLRGHADRAAPRLLPADHPAGRGDHHRRARGCAVQPSSRTARISLGLLGLALIGVVGLAKGVSPTIESGVEAAGLHHAVVGVIIALLVLLPETIAALRSARRGRVQTSLNLALGSAMASIGLTIPAVALASVWLSGPLVLGLGSTYMVLLALTVVVSSLTVVPGRATPLQGGVHLVLFAAYLELAINP